MKNIKKIIIIGTLIAGTIASGIGLNSRINKTVEVPIGRARYTNKKILRSKGFDSCSAVVLDYENKAVMAHAPTYSGINYSSIPLQEHDYVDARNVAEYLTNKIKETGINPKKCKAFINAGNNKSLEMITTNFRRLGIEIKQTKLDRRFRDIQYNPKTNKFIVKLAPATQAKIIPTDFYGYSPNFKD